MGKCDAGSGVLFSACLPVSQSLGSDARCCNADSRVVSLSLVFPSCDAGFDRGRVSRLFFWDAVTTVFRLL